MDTILKIDSLTKKYPSLFAVSQLSLSIDKGSVFGLLGPNGSGKTTTIGKIANQISSEKKVLIAACDTFRAAAIEQLEDWANKIGVKTIDVETKRFDAFFNINTKKDLEEAQKILQEYKND